MAGLRILVLDDNEDNRDMLAAYFRACQAHVISAATPGKALSMLDLFEFDTIVSDLVIPETHGFDFIRRVRKDSELNKRVFAIAASGFPHSRSTALDAGYDLHFMKPVDLDALSAAILNRGQAGISGSAGSAG